MIVRVFAYGSNMCSGRFRTYGVNPKGPGVPALLNGYRLRFNKRSTLDGSGKANVEQHEGSEVWGVLYEVSGSELVALNRGEGGYGGRSIPVKTAGREAVDAWVYVASTPDPDPALRPYTWYKRFLVDGALEHGLPQPYIEMLQALEGDEDADHDRGRRNRELPCSE